MANSTESADRTKNLSFEQGWPVLQEAINKIIDHIEGVHHHQFTSEEYMRIYTVVYEMCKFNPHAAEPAKLYEQYQKSFEDYVSSKVLPRLKGNNGEILLKELVQQWDKYKIMQFWLSRYFHYLSRYFVPLKKLPSLQETSHLVFYDLVYGEMNDQVKDAVIFMINREREGEQIDQALVKTVLEIYVEMAEGSMKYYEKDFETAMLTDTAQFYSQKASGWISTDSSETYMLKVVEHELLKGHASKQIRRDETD